MTLCRSDQVKCPRYFLLAFFLTVNLTTRGFAEDVNRTEVTQSPTTPALGASKKKPDLPNFHEVHPFLYRGGEPSEEGLAELKKMGVSTVIDLRAPSERKTDEPEQAKKLGLHYINLVMDSHAPTQAQVDKMMSTVDEAKKETEAGEKNKKVFLHCAHGSDRTGCMVGIWRVTRDGWDYPAAYQEMRKYYFGPKFTKLSGAVEERAKDHATNPATSE